MNEIKPSEFAEASGRDVAAILDPCPLTIIGAADEEGRIGLATVIWAMPVSHNPAMLAIALRAKSHTMGIVRQTGRFSLTTLPSDEESVRIVEHCGNNTGHRLDKTQVVECEIIDGLPVPVHALSWELCEVESISEAGDHLLVLAKVSSAASRASRDEKNRLAPVETLLCIQHGAYAPVGSAL